MLMEKILVNVKVKLSLWLTKHHAMKMHWGGGRAPHILNLSTGWRWDNFRLSLNVGMDLSSDIFPCRRAVISDLYISWIKVNASHWLMSKVPLCKTDNVQLNSKIIHCLFKWTHQLSWYKMPAYSNTKITAGYGRIVVQWQSIHSFVHPSIHPSIHQSTDTYTNTHFLFAVFSFVQWSCCFIVLTVYFCKADHLHSLLSKQFLSVFKKVHL